MDRGRVIECLVPFMGAEGRFEDYVYLNMLQREWERLPDLIEGGKINVGLSGVSHKASVVLLFWVYFETRIERLLRLGMDAVPSPLLEDTLERYSSIGSRLTKLYKVVFGVTYENDLKRRGHEDLWKHLHEVQRRRNRFMHGYPQEIDDALAEQVVKYVKIEHEVWIEIYNNCIKKSNESKEVGGGHE